MDTMNTKLAINPVEMPDIVREAILSAEDLMKFVFYQYMTEDIAPELTVTSEPIEIEATIFPKYNICSIEIDQGQKKLKFEGIPVPTQIKELVYHSHNNRVLLTAPNPKGYQRKYK